MINKKNSFKAATWFGQGLHSPNWTKLLPWLVSCALLTGCAHHYDIILTNGNRVTNVTKPVLDRSRGVFVYKDVAGNEHAVSAGRVVDIGPHSRKNEVPNAGPNQ